MEPSVRLNAGELSERLEALYSSFRETKRAAENARGWGDRLFGHLFTSASAPYGATTEAGFYKAVETTCIELAEALGGEAGSGADIADRAVSFMLFHHEEKLKSSELMILACEYLCSPLLPRLQRDRLEAIRAEYVSRTPIRMMLPKQKELLDIMDETLASRQS